MEQEDFGVAASDTAFLRSNTMKSRVRRAQSQRCYASSAAMQSKLEAQLIGGLNAKLAALRAGGQLTGELADLAGRMEFMPRCAGLGEGGLAGLGGCSSANAENMLMHVPTGPLQLENLLGPTLPRLMPHEWFDGYVKVTTTRATALWAWRCRCEGAGGLGCHMV